MRFLICLIFLLLLRINSYTQNYTRDAGFRVGKGILLSYRQFFDDERAIEGYFGFTKNGLRVTGLREYFAPIARVRSDNLKLMCGYGVHAGISYSNKYKVMNRVYRRDNWSFSPQFGIDGIVGIEYTATEFPVLISAAIQPYFEFSLDQYFTIQPFDMFIAIKYRF